MKHSCILALLLARAALANINVWALPDSVRLNPQSGRLFEERTIPSNYRHRSSVWDGSRRVVSLHAARNEFVAFQLVLEALHPTSGINVEVSPLGASNARIQIFKAWYVQVRRPSTGYEATSLGPGWYPDALLPKRPSGLRTGFPFSIPDIHNNIPNQTSHTVWIDVYVPRDTAPGRYQSKIQVRWQGGESSLPLDLEVGSLTLPDASSLRGDIFNNSMARMPAEQELKYYQLAQQHRFQPGVYAYRPDLKPKLDWTSYDARITKYLDGSAFTSQHNYWGPGYGQPLEHLLLPFDCERGTNRARAWPSTDESVWREIAPQVRQHFDANPHFRRVRKIVFLDGLDESYNEAAYQKMLSYGRLLHETLGRGWFQYRIDGGYSPEAMQTLASEVDLWVNHTVSFDIDLVDRLRPKGLESWFYGPMVYEQRRNSGCGSNTFTDLDLLTNRAIGWIAWKYQSGWIEWEFDWNAFAGWYEAENFKENGRVYNGSGLLIYRGEVMGYNEPIPSIRLKAQRRGLQDYEYFQLLAAKEGKPAADRLVNGIVHARPFGRQSIGNTNLWNPNPESWDAVRRLIASENPETP